MVTRCVSSLTGLLRSSPVRRQVCLELDRRSIAERRMQPLAVVDLFDEGADLLAGIIDVAIVSSVDLLLLERLHEALGLGIVVGIADAAHAGLDVAPGKDGGVFG